MKLPSWWHHPAVPFVAPFAVFLAGSLLECSWVHPMARYVVYPLKITIVALLLITLWKRLPDLKPGQWVGASAVGILCFAVWVGLEPLLGIQHTASCGFNPFAFKDPVYPWVLIVFRFVGLVALAPLVMELFWRGFFMRLLIKPDIASVPLGTYTHFSFWTTTVCIVLVDATRWPFALVSALLFGGLFLRTRRLGDVVWAHAVSHFLLALLVLLTRRWYLW